MVSPQSLEYTSSRDDDKPTILIIITGGTVTMQPNTENVLTPEPMERRLRELSELNDPLLPKFDVCEWETLYDSSDMRLQQWTVLAQNIKKAYRHYDGFVIVHGTDTMAYTASALSFMLENLTKPVIFTGSMLPLSNFHTDGKRNLSVSVLLAGYSQICEVCILFGSKLLRATRTSKIDCSQIDAFDSLNFPPLGRTGVNMTIDDNLSAIPRRSGFQIFTKFCMNVFVITMTPDSTASMIDYIVEKGSRPMGIILRLYGTGTLSSQNMEMIAAIKKAIKSGVEVVVISQCSRGSCNLSIYESGNELSKLGVINGRDMTIEAAFTKMCYLLGKGYKSEAFGQKMETNLRGDITVESNIITGVISQRNKNNNININENNNNSNEKDDFIQCNSP